MFICNTMDENLLPVSEERLLDTAAKVLRAYDEDDAELTLSFVTPKEIHILNKQYREVDAVTDVLSFESGGVVDPESGRAYLGDILVCTERAEEQAKLSGHSLENEVLLLLIHGMLHLMGYDHYTDEEKVEMWREQEDMLKLCDVQLNRKPGEDFDF